MSPTAYRATFPGVMYQLGNVRHCFYTGWARVAYVVVQMVSSAASQIEASTLCSVLNAITIQTDECFPFFLSFCISAGGDHLKTTVVKNGKVTVVPDYATVCNALVRYRRSF